MRQRQLGSDGLVTSAIGLGCMGFSQGYGPTDDDQSLAAIQRALELDVTMIDTAMSYRQGHNERLVGQALAGYAGTVHLATKFGIVRGDTGVRLDGQPEHVRGYCDASLERLGVDVIDLYYLHRVDPAVPIGETIGAMSELVADGKVRHIGVCEVTPEQLEAANAVHPISAVQFEWSLLWRDPERDVVPTARRLGIGLIPYSPLGRGLLTGTLQGDTDIDTSEFRRNDPRFHGDHLRQNQRNIAELGRLAATLGVTPGQLALAWLLAQGSDVVPIPGSRRADRIAENAAAAELELSASDLQLLDSAVPGDGWAGDRQSFAVPTTVRPRLP